MLRRVHIKNFKSLLDTEIGLSKNSFLIGMNGTGKTTILQVIDFVSTLAREDNAIQEWLDARGWHKKDLTFYGNKKLLIELEIEFVLNAKAYQWSMAFNSNTLKCSSEQIIVLDTQKELLHVDNGAYSIQKGKKEKINFKHTGSIISSLKKEILGEELANIAQFFVTIHSAELLSPILMKKRAKEASDGIGLGGEKLSAFLNGLTDEKQNSIKDKLIKFFPQIESFETSSLRAGWKKLSLHENYNNKTVITESKHLSDGVLRILAILTQLEITDSVLIFDEIEDGINQEFVEMLVDVLVDSPHQTIIATHSPMLLNYLEDEVAKESMLFVYKTDKGETKVANFFDVIAKHSDITEHEYNLFGPGELMQRVDLIELSNSIKGS